MKWLLIVAGLLCSAGAQAAQFGGFLALGAGRGDEKTENGTEVDVDQQSFEAGFIMHLGKAGRAVAYRLHAGVAIRNTEAGDDDPNAVTDQISDTQALTLHNTLSFNFIDRPRLRFWAGPSLYLSAGTVEYGDNNTGNFDESFVAIGAGPTVGLDFGFGERGPMMGLELAYRVSQLKYDDDNIGFDKARLNDVSLRLSLLFGD